MIVALTIGSASAQQVCGPFSMTVSGGDTATLVSCGLVSGTTYDLTVTATADGGNNVITCTIDVTTNPRSIGTATFTNTAGSGVELRIVLRGSSPTNDPVVVSSIVRGGGSNGAVRLDTLSTVGDVGTISVSSIGLVTVGGDLTGDITCTTGNLGTLEVNGSISGTTEITVSNGRIDLINVPTSGGDIGASNNPAIIECEELRRLFVAGDVWARVTVQESTTPFAYGPIGRFDVGGTIGIVDDDTAWDVGDIDDIAGGSIDPGFYVTGNQETPITFNGDVDEPIEILGDLSAGAQLHVTG